MPVETKIEIEAAVKAAVDPILVLTKYGIPGTPLRGKAPFLQGWQNSASKDAVQLGTWKQIPGVTGFGGVAKAEIGGFWALETDSVDVAKRYKADTGESLPNDGLITKSRQGGHRWFKHTPESIAMGNISQADVVGGDFSVRAHNEQCVMSGSLHPSGIVYELVNDAPPKEAPTKLIAWLIKQKCAAPKSVVQDLSQKEVFGEGERNNALFKLACKLRRDGLEKDELEPILIRFNLEQCVPSLSEQEVKTICGSAVKYEKESNKTKLTVGGVDPGVPLATSASSLEQIEKQNAVQALVDSTPHSQEEATPFADSLYPYWAFNKTWYEEFANFCGRGNRVPKEFFIESARALVGAICGHRFSPHEGRFYTFILSKVGGIGKGTAFGAIKDLLIGTGLLYGLNQDGPGAFLNIGCAQGTFSSSAGLLNNGFAKHGRIIQIYDELTKMIEKFSIPGSGDAYLDDLNTLFESNAYMPSHTKDSKVNVVTGTQHLSILGGTTFDKWNSAFVKTTAEGSGFFQRLNVVSSEETETVAEIPPFNFNEGDGLILRNKLLSKITPLEFQKVVFEKTPEAAKMFDDWHVKFKQEHRDDPGEVIGRLNVMVTRNYEHLAFMLAPDAHKSPENAEEPIRIVCDALTMEKAIALSEYQYITRAKHRPAQGANESALIEDMIRLTLRAADKQRLSRSDLYKKSGLRKYGLQSFNRVLDAMNNEGIVMVGQKTSNAVDSPVRGRKGQVIIWVGDRE